MGFPGGTSGKEPACQCRRLKRCRFDLLLTSYSDLRTSVNLYNGFASIFCPYFLKTYLLFSWCIGPIHGTAPLFHRERDIVREGEDKFLSSSFCRRAKSRCDWGTGKQSFWREKEELFSLPQHCLSLYPSGLYLHFSKLKPRGSKWHVQSHIHSCGVPEPGLDTSSSDS